MTRMPPDTSRQTVAHDRRPWRAWRRSRFARRAATAMLIAVLAGCASAGSASRPRPSSTGSAGARPSSPGAPASRTSSHGSAGSRPQAYAACMRAHGVPNFPDPVDGHFMLTPSSGIDPSSPSFQAAAQACASLGPSSSPASASRSSAPAAGSPVGAQAAGRPTAATWAALAGWLGQRAAAGRFSGAVLVAHGATALHDAGYGLADRATGTPNTPQTKFCIASIGKLFTAVAIAQLVEQGKLSFAATVGRYVSGLPAPIADRVTIAELLTMTSGLDDVVLSRPHPPTSLAAMVRLIANERPRLAPGTRFLYSNDGYILLGAIIEHVSGESYVRYVSDHILTPAGMTHTSLRPYVPARVPGMAHGYTLAPPRGTPHPGAGAPAPGSPSTPDALRDDSDTAQIANPSGGAYSTIGDLLRFSRALTGHRLLSAAMTATILAPRVASPQPGGPPVDDYTYGFAYEKLDGVAFVGHNGGTPGYEGEIDIYPRSGYTVVVLTNQDQVMMPAIRHTESILSRLG